MMSLPRESKARDVIEQDFVDALQRLIEGKPNHKKLKASHKTGKLKVNAVNVALEAGRSRTLIGMDGCRYPAVREAIRLAQGGKKSVPSTYTQLIQNLRSDLAQAKADNKMLQLQITAHFTARMTAEENARRDAMVTANLRRELLELHKVVGLASKEAAPLPRLVLIRGLPGTGKTTRAKGYKEQGYEHFEADMFFESDGTYAFTEEKLPEAHAWCLQQTRQALAVGAHVVVSNVFCGVQDIKPYIDLGFEFQVIEVTGRGKSVHGVSPSVLRAMKANWVTTDALLGQINSKGKVKNNVTNIANKKDRS